MLASPTIRNGIFNIFFILLLFSLDTRFSRFKRKYYTVKSLSVLTGRWRTFRRLNFRIRLSNYFAEYRGTVYTDLIYFCGSLTAQAETGKISCGSGIRIRFLKHRVASGDTFIRAAVGFREFIRNDSGTFHQTFYMYVYPTYMLSMHILCFWISKLLIITWKGYVEKVRFLTNMKYYDGRNRKNKNKCS